MINKQFPFSTKMAPRIIVKPQKIRDISRADEHPEEQSIHQTAKAKQPHR